MTTLVPDKEHPALSYPEVERVDYLSVVASMAFADRKVDDRELERLVNICRDLGLSADSIEKIENAAHNPSQVDIEQCLERLRGSELRFALMVDLTDIAYADEVLEDEEATELHRVAELLDINESQRAMTQRFVEEKRGIENAQGGSGNSAAAVGVGVPAAALTVAAAIGAPIAIAAGVAASLGVGSYLSVKWLANRGKRTADSSSESED